MCSTPARKRSFTLDHIFCWGCLSSQSFKVGALQNFRRRLLTHKVWPAAKLCSSAALSRHRPHSAWTWRLQQQVSLIITALNNLIIGFSPVKRSGIVMAESMDCYMYTSCQRTLRIECNKSIGVNNISEHIFKFLFYSQTPWIWESKLTKNKPWQPLRVATSSLHTGKCNVHRFVMFYNLML